MPQFITYRKSDGFVVHFKPNNIISPDEIAAGFDVLPTTFPVGRDILRGELREVLTVDHVERKMRYRGRLMPSEADFANDGDEDHGLDTDLEFANRRGIYMGSNMHEARAAIFRWAYPTLDPILWPTNNAVYNIIHRRGIRGIRKIVPGGPALRKLWWAFNHRCWGEICHAVELLPQPKANEFRLDGLTQIRDRQCVQIVRS